MTSESALAEATDVPATDPATDPATAPDAASAAPAVRAAGGSAPGTVIAGRRLRYDPHHCFACGELNEHGLRIVLHTDGRRTWTQLALDPRFQGWDGIAHGGILCTLLDEVMAWSVIASDRWGVTARMSVEFKRPVPIAHELRAEGWVTEPHRRLIRTAGRILDAETGETLATAEGIFMAAPPERLAELKRRYRLRVESDAESADTTMGVDP